MPLNERGQKLRDKFRGQYGKKKGDSVFYAMENSGKLKGILKASVGGGADAGGKKSPGKGTYKSPAQKYVPGPGDTGGPGGGNVNLGGGNQGGNNQKSVSTKKSFGVPIIGPITSLE